jgi:3-isopropylmalate dehydrogenase
MLSAAMLFEWLASRHSRPEFEHAAKAIEAAIDQALKSSETRTRDLGGTFDTDAFGRHIAERIA